MHILLFNENKSLCFSINSGAVESGKKYHCTPKSFQLVTGNGAISFFWMRWDSLAILPYLLQYHRVNGHSLRSVSVLPILCYLEFFIIMKKFDHKMCLYFHNLMLQIFRKTYTYKSFSFWLLTLLCYSNMNYFLQ